MGIIEIENMEFYAYHGHFEAEQIVGNKFEVYLHMETNCEPASKSDNLDDALDYQKAYELVKDEVLIPSKLLEHVGGRILERLYDEFDNLNKATIKISKMNPPMGGKIGKVSVALTR